MATFNVQPREFKNLYAPMPLDFMYSMLQQKQRDYDEGMANISRLYKPSDVNALSAIEGYDYSKGQYNPNIDVYANEAGIRDQYNAGLTQRINHLKQLYDQSDGKSPELLNAWQEYNTWNTQQQPELKRIQQNYDTYQKMKEAKDKGIKSNYQINDWLYTTGRLAQNPGSVLGTAPIKDFYDVNKVLNDEIQNVRQTPDEIAWARINGTFIDKGALEWIGKQRLVNSTYAYLQSDPQAMDVFNSMYDADVMRNPDIENMKYTVYDYDYDNRGRLKAGKDGKPIITDKKDYTGRNAYVMQMIDSKANAQAALLSHERLKDVNKTYFNPWAGLLDKEKLKQLTTTSRESVNFTNLTLLGDVDSKINDAQINGEYSKVDPLTDFKKSVEDPLSKKLDFDKDGKIVLTTEGKYTGDKGEYSKNKGPYKVKVTTESERRNQQTNYGLNEDQIRGTSIVADMRKLNPEWEKKSEKECIEAYEKMNSDFNAVNAKVIQFRGTDKNEVNQFYASQGPNTSIVSEVDGNTFVPLKDQAGFWTEDTRKAIRETGMNGVLPNPIKSTLPGNIVGIFNQDGKTYGITSTTNVDNKWATANALQDIENDAIQTRKVIKEKIQDKETKDVYYVETTPIPSTEEGGRWQTVTLKWNTEYDPTTRQYIPVGKPVYYNAEQARNDAADNTFSSNLPSMGTKVDNSLINETREYRNDSYSVPEK